MCLFKSKVGCDVYVLCCVWNIYRFKLLFAGNECCERLAYYGMSTNLVLYFKNRLNQHSATASKNVSNWSGTCYITPLIGAYLADSYLGRYWTIAVFSIIYAIVSMVSSIVYDYWLLPEKGIWIWYSLSGHWNWGFVENLSMITLRFNIDSK